jgi:hypothetical protein
LLVSLKLKGWAAEEASMEVFMFGYIDPGTGATMMQLVVAGTAGIGIVVKLKWHKIRGFFDRSDATIDQSPDGASDVRDVPEHRSDPRA